MRANLGIKARRHEQHRQNLARASDAARIDLAEGDRLGLEELAEHHLVKERGEEGGGGGGGGIQRTQDVGEFTDNSNYHHPRRMAASSRA